MTRFLKILLLILFINIFVFNNYQIGYTEPTQQANSNQPIITKVNNETPIIANEAETGSEYLKLINWLEQNYSIEERQINEISSQSLAPKYALYIFSFKDLAKKGYMVIKDNLEIIEYGEGSYTPYQTDIICDEEIKELEATKFFYFSPLENYWQYNYNNEVVNIDGATGEWLPQISEPIKRDERIKYFNITNITTGSKKISAEAIFDPYENMYWLLADADQNTEQLTLDMIIDSIDINQKIIYVGAKYDGMVRFAYPVIGYQKIDDLTYLALYDQYLDLIRFFPYDEMKEFGVFSIYQP